MDNKFVSRGGTKLEHALKTFEVDVTGKIALDVGSSTGGFVDCLLQYGAAKVYSLDTAYGELAWKLRIDPKVVVIERQNIMHFDSLAEKVDLITIDVTFTPLAKIVEKVQKFLKPQGQIIALLKPQYEDQDLALKNRGIIPETSLKEILDNTLLAIKYLGLSVAGKTDSPILGGSGNREFLLLISL